MDSILEISRRQAGSPYYQGIIKQSFNKAGIQSLMVNFRVQLFNTLKVIFIVYPDSVRLGFTMSFYGHCRKIRMI